jgi:Uma2 family endonuclease
MVEKMPNEEHGSLILLLGGKLLTFAKKNNLGIVTTDALHHVEDDDENAYLPDISFTSFARKKEIIKRGAVPMMPDLAVEIKSPNDTYAEIRRKAIYYIEQGTRLVWLVFPARLKIEVWSAETDEIITLAVHDVLDGGSVLPGFSISVAEIFGM